jgi:hypothetical protein
MKKLVIIASFSCIAVLAMRVVADDDMEKVQAARRTADAEIQKRADEIAKRTEANIKDVEARLAEVQKWTNAQFELGERNIIDKPKAMTALMQRWQSQRENEICQLLQFPEKSGGAIETGRALNAMMDRVGVAAFQNAETRKVHPYSAFPMTASTDYTRVTRELAEEITWQENVLGAKSVGQGSRGLLDLDWPVVLREDRWKEQRQRCDDARKKALAEIRALSHMSTESDKELREAIADLNVEFAKYRRERVGGDHAGGVWPLEYRRICDGSSHIKKLVLGIYQLAELTSDQVIRREPFDGGTIEDYMAYLQRHNLRFAPAAPAHRSAYYKVFGMMVRYYLDEKMAVNLEQQLDKELADLKQTNQAAIDAALGRTMSASDQAAIRILELKNIYELLK